MKCAVLLLVLVVVLSVASRSHSTKRRKSDKVAEEVVEVVEVTAVTAVASGPLQPGGTVTITVTPAKSLTGSFTPRIAGGGLEVTFVADPVLTWAANAHPKTFQITATSRLLSTALPVIEFDGAIDGAAKPADVEIAFAEAEWDPFVQLKFPVINFDFNVLAKRTEAKRLVQLAILEYHVLPWGNREDKQQNCFTFKEWRGTSSCHPTADHVLSLFGDGEDPVVTEDEEGLAAVRDMIATRNGIATLKFGKLAARLDGHSITLISTASGVYTLEAWANGQNFGESALTPSTQVGSWIKQRHTHAEATALVANLLNRDNEARWDAWNRICIIGQPWKGFEGWSYDKQTPGIPLSANPQTPPVNGQMSLQVRVTTLADKADVARKWSAQIQAARKFVNEAKANHCAE